MTSASTATSFNSAADPKLLKPIRDYVKKTARSLGADATTIHDFELVASELSTNVINHTSADTVTVTFRCENDTWILDVSGADDLDERGASCPAQPPHTALGGRGLFIAHVLMDTVEIVEIDQQRYVRCTKDVS